MISYLHLTETLTT